MSDPAIAVVIPALNEAGNLAAAIASAREAGADQVIVVDGGSQDATWEIALAAGCQAIRSPAGRGTQMNHGAGLSTCAVLIFLHADNCLDPGCLRQIRGVLAGGEPGWGAFRQQIDHPGLLYRWIEQGNALRVRWQSLIYGDQAMFVSRNLLDAVGGFPNWPLMEDFEISRRLARLAKPHLLPGPVRVSPRRWVARGPLRQTWLNWKISALFRWGVSPERLSHLYRTPPQPKK